MSIDLSFATQAATALTETVSLDTDVTGVSLTIEFSDRSDFATIRVSKTATGAGKNVTFSLSATEVDSLKGGRYRIKAGSVVYASGAVHYVAARASSGGAPLVNGVVPDANLPSRLSDSSLAAAYGAVTIVNATGSADSAAIVSAFNSMKVNGHATGTLFIKGDAVLDTTVDLDGGFLDTENPSNWSSVGTPRFRLVAQSLKPAAGVGTGLRLHGFYGLNLDASLRGGGAANDTAIEVYNLHQPDLNIEAINFAGTVLRGDTYVGTTLDATRRIRGGRVAKLHVSNCGRALFWRGIEAFGSFEHVWDNNCVNGSYIGFCADTELTHYENFSPASQAVGLTLEGCNNFNGGVITMGDRASECLVKIIGNTADPAGTVFSSDFGSINRIRATCYAPGGTITYNAIHFVDVHSAVVDNISTAKALVGVQVTGSNVFIKKHHSYSSDATALVVEGDAYNAAPIVEVGAHYRFTAGSPVSLAASLTGGVVKVSGHIESNIFSAGGASTGYALTSASTGTLDVAGLTVDNVAGMLGLTNHPVGKLRGTQQARYSNNAPAKGSIWYADGSGNLTRMTPGSTGQVPTYQSDGSLAPAAGGGGGSSSVLSVGTAQTVVTNTTTATTVAGPSTIAGNSVAAGSVYRIRAWGTVDNDASATVTLRCRLGGPTGTSIANPFAITSASAKTAQGWNLDYIVVFRAAASAATPVSVGGQSYTQTSGSSTSQGAVATSVNMTVARDLGIDATWSAATATNIIRCEGFTVEKIA